jgi:ribosomal protein L37AE/L43A
MVASSVDVRTTARAALARIRLLRALRRSSMVREAVAVVGALLPVLVCVAGFTLVLAAGGPRQMSDAPLVLALVVLVMLGAIALVIAALPVGMGLVAAAAMYVLIAPWSLVRAIRATRRWRLRRHVEAMLDRDGAVPATWGAGNPERVGVLATLALADPWLEHRDGMVTARALGCQVCAHCGGASTSIGDGVWRCGHCAREAFAELPATVELSTARTRLSAVADGRELPRTRRALWRAFVDRHGADYLQVRRRALWLVGIYLGLAAIAELGWRLKLAWLWGPGLAGIVVLALVVLYVGSVASWEWFQLRFVRFGPGVATYERALLGEVVACVALQGRMRRSVLAAHLGVSVEHLDTVLASFARLGGAPVLFDRTRDELVSLCGMEIGDRTCPACGGELTPIAGAKIACRHCTAVLRVGGHHVAPHAA